MKAVYLNQQGNAESLIFGDIAKPQPGAGEALVRVHATAITPAEFQWHPTFHAPSGGPRQFPIVLGHEFSGVVEALSPGVEHFKVGDAVFGLNDWFANGAQAEYCVAPAAALAHKPRLLDHVQAAAVPISALTAWQGLLEKTKLQAGQRILIHGAAGGVGVFAVQLARWRGAHVIATASSGNLDFVRMIGAHEVIDYRTSRFEDIVHEVDVVFDSVGGETLDRSWNILVKNGRLVTVAAQNATAAEQRVRDAFMLVRPSARQLKQIAELIDGGELRVYFEGVFPLTTVHEAYARAQQGKMRGKIVLSVQQAMHGSASANFLPAQFE